MSLDDGNNPISNVILDAAKKVLGNGVELIFGPHRVKAIGDAKAETSAYAIRKAAEAKAYEIVTLEQARIDAEELRHKAHSLTLERAKERVISTEIVKQTNVEAILELAMKSAGDANGDAKPRPIDSEWMMHFFDGAAYISNDKLREIWAKIIYRQARADTQAASIMTLDCLRLLDAELADVFVKSANLLSYMSIISDGNLISLVSDYPMPERTHLDRLCEIGLLTKVEKEDLFSMVGGAFLALDKKCFETFAPMPKFFRLSIRGAELACAILKDYKPVNTSCAVARRTFSAKQLKEEIGLMLLNSVLPGSLKARFSLEIPRKRGVSFNLVQCESLAVGDHDYIFYADISKPKLEKTEIDEVLKEFFEERVKWKYKKKKKH